MLDKGKIQELLGTGLSNDVVANAVGCASAYITQLLADPEFATAVAVARSAALTSNTNRDRRIDGIEDALISRLSDLVDQDMLYKPRDILHAFHVLNNAKRRGVPAHANITQQQTVVALILPRAVQKQFTITPQGEVVEMEDEIEGAQTLVTMSSDTLLGQLAREKGEIDGQRYKEVAKYLPSAAGKG